MIGIVSVFEVFHVVMDYPTMSWLSCEGVTMFGLVQQAMVHRKC